MRRWYFGIAAAAALIPLSANADPVVMNLQASPNFVSQGVITIDYGGVEASNNVDGLPGSLNGGTCSGGTSGAPTGCKEEGFAVGDVSSLTINGNNVWSSGVVSPANPNGYALAFVVYGGADLSQTVVGNTTTSDTTGMSAGLSQTVTYNTTGGIAPTTDTVTFTGDGFQHLDLYFMPGNQIPCFSAGLPGCDAAHLVTATDRTGFGTVHGVTDVVGGGLFASLTFAPGVVPLNTLADGSSNSNVVSVSSFSQTAFATVGASRAYLDCVSSGPTTPPGCSNFSPVTEAMIDATGTGYFGDPAHSGDIVNAFLKNTIGAASVPQSNGGWTFSLSDPVNAVAQVPEPGSLALLGSALTLLGVAVRRRRRSGTPA